VLCFISFAALVLRPSNEATSFLPLFGIVATLFGIWLEVFRDTSQEQSD
jgi:hypothetical protein